MCSLLCLLTMQLKLIEGCHYFLIKAPNLHHLSHFPSARACTYASLRCKDGKVDNICNNGQATTTSDGSLAGRSASAKEPGALDERDPKEARVDKAPNLHHLSHFPRARACTYASLHCKDGKVDNICNNGQATTTSDGSLAGRSASVKEPDGKVDNICNNGQATTTSDGSLAGRSASAREPGALDERDPKEARVDKAPNLHHLSHFPSARACTYASLRCKDGKVDNICNNGQATTTSDGSLAGRSASAKEPGALDERDPKEARVE
ncbi:hypothetical protein F2Q70_00027235 [Brassica cretica]|uniref:Uncharacterized protein n=1 Tax=Brassica cretica TaxID=69181 RepID=A0A8S9LFL5_BRACR|nr:hypothetical protein F2Q70_00027235 [Brassica cretica]